MIVPWKAKWIVGPLMLFISGLLYAFTNRFHLNTPIELPLSRIDKWVPFLPWTVWIYVSEIFYFIFVYSINRCVISLNKQLYAFLTLILFCNLIYFIFPVHYPRELYPIPAHSDLWSSALLEKLRSIDLPFNCTPSLHVAIAYQIAFAFLDDLRKYFPWLLLWATLLSLSTLTTKQHYFVDVILGILVATFNFIIFNRILNFRTVGNQLTNKTITPRSSVSSAIH